MSIKCCKGCEERTIEPNCHMTCERYLEALEEHHRIRDQKIREKHVWDYLMGHLAHKGRPR